MEHTTEIRIGKTLFIVKSECSPNATATMEQKLKKLIIQHISGRRRVIKRLSECPANQLAMCPNQSENGYYQLENREEF